MFHWFNKNKEYLSCSWLEYGIYFSFNGLYHCCMFSHSHENDFPVSLPNANLTYNFKDFFNKKQLIRKQQRRGIINNRCLGCFSLEKKFWIPDNKIRKIAIGTNTACNSCCIYCTTPEKRKMLNKRPDIPIFEFFKKAINKDMITPECEIEFGGGEPTLMREFEDIMNYLLDKNFKNIKIHSSGIKYSSAIERALKSDCCELVISPDSGNRELYKKIKLTDKFDEVWGNIEKYNNAQNQIKTQVQVKYIIIPKINDSEENIEEFFNQIIKYNVKLIRLDIETNWFIEHNNPKDISQILNTVKFFINKARSLNIKYCNNATLDAIKNQYRDLYSSFIQD
ncbi:radical SAM protein [bacterium]|nr:radical SAM protein [bacterium]